MKIMVRFKTQNPFSGRIFVKGMSDKDVRLFALVHNH